MEVWKNVFGKYEVSTLGNVRNSKTGRLLKQLSDKDGYMRVCLYESGKRYYLSVHRLVGKAFLENVENKPQIDHIDGNKTNNIYTNLRWVTPLENTRNPITREKHLKSIILPKKKKFAVICIETNTMYEGLRVAERETKIHHSLISACCKGQRENAGGFHWCFA